MGSFKDNEGREWQVSITVAAVKRVRELVGVDLLDIADGVVITELATNPIKLVDVVYAICKPQADQARVSDEDFGEAMLGDAIDQATEAVLDALVSFTPNQRDRNHLQTVLSKTNEAMEKARDAIDEAISEGVLDQIVEDSLAQSGESSTS